MTDKKTPIDPITHDDARVSIPSPEIAPLLDIEPIKVAYERRNPDLDPQLIWRGKDIDQAAITADAPPIYLQEQVHPKAIIEDLRAGNKRNGEGGGVDLFDHFGITDEDREAEIEAYQHHMKWSNRMILGDGLQVMASLAEREGLKGQVQAIYIDPPYGINFGSNWQWSTTSRDVKDGNLDHLTREPEQVRAFRDTWRDGIHSYLGYLRDRLVVARELLTESGSCFVQIGDENVHRVRVLMDEVFGAENFVVTVPFKKKGNQKGNLLESISDNVLWVAKEKGKVKFRSLFRSASDTGELERDYSKVAVEGQDLGLRELLERENASNWQELKAKLPRARLFTSSDLTVGGFRANQSQLVKFRGEKKDPGIKRNRCWMHTSQTRESEKYCGIDRLIFADRVYLTNGGTIRRKVFLDDSGMTKLHNWWDDTGGATNPRYVVETTPEVIKRCLLMTTDPGDLVFDPTCGSGTTAYVAEQWGRRWITIDTSRVALALARARIMGAKYPWYLLADSEAGQKKEAAITQSGPATTKTYDDIRHGFVYDRFVKLTSSNVANNTEIDTIWDTLQPAVEAARDALNAALAGHPAPFTVDTGGRKGQQIDFTASGEVEMPSGEMAPAGGFMEWEIPRDAPDGWPEAAVSALADFWEARITRQKEIDASISAKADFEYLYDKPFEDRKRIRVAGPFTVESLSPHRTQAVNEYGELIDEVEAADGKRDTRAQEAENYKTAMLENLRKAGVQQSGKEDAIKFETLKEWPGDWLCAEGVYLEGEVERRAGIFIGPEYGTVQRADLVACAREAADAGFDIVIACAFNFDAHTAEFRKLGRVPVLHARMNPDLHMADDLRAGGGNLFVVFGEPDIKLHEDGEQLKVELFGVDIFKPATGEVVASEPDDIACWFIDTDYNEESFFVRHAYFPGAEVPYKQLKTTLKGEIDEEAWDSLKRTVSRPFNRPKSGRIAVKVINHLGDEVMKVLSA